MHPIAGSPRRARGFARIVPIRARWNPAAGPSFCYASYPAAILDSPNIHGCRCCPAPDTGKTPSLLIIFDILLAIHGEDSYGGTRTVSHGRFGGFLLDRSAPAGGPSHEN